MPLTDDFDSIDDDEYPAPSDTDADSQDASVDTVTCAGCGRAVYESAPYCPRCGTDLSRADMNRTANWIVLTALVCAAGVLLMYLR